MSAPTPNDLYHAAQALVHEGQPIFPCYSVGARAKSPMTTHGLKDATTDLAKIKRWWRRAGDASIGIPTGIVHDVLDVDVKEGNDGRVHLPYLTSLGLLDGCKKVVRSPSGGWHLYFKAAPGLTNKARAALGLDVRASGGYVLASPSYLTDVPRDDGSTYSGAYEVVGETTGSTDEPLMWDLIQSCLAPIDISTNKPVSLLPSERRASVAALREWVSVLKSGERNNGLHWAVCRCIDNNIDPNELVEAALLTGLGEDEVNLTINSALKRAGVVAGDLDTEAEAMFGKH